MNNNKKQSRKVQSHIYFSIHHDQWYVQGMFIIYSKMCVFFFFNLLGLAIKYV